jgi:hypothetical protein
MRLHKQLYFVLGSALTALLILTGPKLYAQLQQSGGPGSSVTLLAGANVIGHVITDASSAVIGHVIVDTAPTTAVTGTFWQTTQPVSIAAAVKTYPSTTCGSTAVGVALGALPTTSTLATSAATTCVIAVYFENSNATALNVTLTDNTGTPLNAVGPAFVIPGLSNMVIPLYGIPFNLGVKWLASGTGGLAGLVGYQ